MTCYLKIFLICCYVFIPWCVQADDICSKYKYDTDVNVVNSTEYNPIIKFSDENMVGRMGETAYNTTYAAKILSITIPVKNGYCISLRSVDVDINVPKFTITVDKRLKSSKCAYDIVLSHEQDHVNVNKNVINDNLDNIKKAVKKAADTIKPVFVSKQDEKTDIQLQIQKQIESSEYVKYVKQKIEKEMNEKNDDIDTRGDSFDIWNCKDFYEEMKKFSDKITID